MADFNFSVSTEGLQEKGQIIGDEVQKIREALNDIKEVRNSLDGWVSQNKEKYDSKIASGIPKLQEMVDSIDKYSKVAKETVSRIVNVENKIAAAIDNDDVAA